MVRKIVCGYMVNNTRYFSGKKDSRSKILLPFLGGGDLRNFPQKFLDIFAQKFQDDSVRKNLDTSAGKFL
jgi:hypothetical protein